jgi:RNA polymerase sigma factor (sigma-70 family)
MPAFGLARFGDEPLARLVPAGDERAFAALYERYHQPLYRYCRSIVRDEADAQDALQSTFARALVALRRGQRNAPVRPWLFRIAHNEAISVLRRRDGSGELSEAAIQSVPSAADQAGERERFALLVADLHELPERLRGALLMRELSGLSHEEIAIALETSPGAAKQAIFDARRELLAFAEGRAMACDEILRNLSDGDRRVLRGRRVRAHLRDCQTCAAFAAAIPARRSELQAFVPALPPVASAAMLARLVGSGSGHGAGGGAAAAAAAGAAGKAVGASVAAKVLVGAAVVAVVGATGATVVLTHTHHGTSRPPAALHAAPAAGGVAQRSTRTAAGVRASEAGGRGAKALRLGATGGSVAGAPGIARARAAGGAAKALGLAQSSASAAGRSHGQGSPVQGGAAPGRSGAAPGRSGSTPATVRHAGGPSASSLAASHRGGNGGTHASGANGSSHRAAGGGASSVASSTPAGTAPSSSQASRSGQTPAASRRSSHAVRLAATSGAG